MSVPRANIFFVTPVTQVTQVAGTLYVNDVFVDASVRDKTDKRDDHKDAGAVDGSDAGVRGRNKAGVEEPESVLFIGTQFSILYTSMYSPAETATPRA
jgi:hypothetical protein